MTQEPEFLQWMNRRLSSPSAPAMIVPATERTMVPLSRHFELPEQRHRFAMPSHAALERVLDKAQTTELATQCGVAQPRNWTIHSLEDIDRLASLLEFPLVVKPARSIPEGGLRQALTVRYAHSIAGLRNIAQDMLTHTHLVLQEYFRGDGIGVEVLVREGTVEYAFQHRRLHEVPLSGGGSSLRVSEDLDPQLLAASKALMAELGWNGVAMIEFKQDRATKDFILVEINGRFWGSLPLAVAAGADFPRLLWALHQGHSLPNLGDYKRGVKCRKLSSDLNWLEAVLRKDADTRLVALPSPWQALGQTLKMFLPGERFDAQSFTDPVPGLKDIGTIISKYINRATDLFTQKWQKWRITRASTEREIAEKLGTANRLLFVCYGNINRSALAQALCEQLGSFDKRPECKSAGFHLETGRRADKRMVALAAANDIDLTKSRSVVLDAELIDWADLILVMECHHVSQVQAVATNKPVMLLGGTTNASFRAGEIPDPYNQPETVYKAVYSQLEQCIQALLATWNRSRATPSSRDD